MTLAVKDNICTASLPTTCSSAMLAGYTSPFDATVVELLRDEGAQIIGKANCDEFGMGSLNVNSIHGPVVNPFQPTDAYDVPLMAHEPRSAGGSSGGSAASVAARLCTAALGTDTGGSVRLPASYCGVVGLKPSYGLISRWGVVSFADSLDCVGVLARSVDTVKEVFDVISVYDARDPTAASPELRKRASSTAEPCLPKLFSSNTLDGLRIGVPQEYFPLELEPSITSSLRTIIRNLKDAGATIRPVSLPATQYALSAYYVIASAEASSNLARFDGIQYGLRVPPPAGASRSKPSNVYAHSRSSGFGREVRKRILLGTYALTADAFDNYFLQAQRVRAYIKADFNRVFRHPCVHLAHPESCLSADGVDVLLHPSAIRTAPRLAEKRECDTSSIDEYLQDVMTVPASLAGLPALSVPAGLGEDGWPVGMSVVGQWGTDQLVLQVGRVIEGIR
ncbi:amidase signature enzyme [Boletus edulis]|uniref:Glutamyl-tRNA(Gln) amidotransferase subunit A, mitochondrial n=1 Tax=Boletus edulis BED1 TaxID=1328754 RepID=A0AAD4C577_BOLED|nr:amidase signature enzyme [Boletus edulis]KAF8448765.1 amidase signature enzyme [Boletus edulis BED1]